MTTLIDRITKRIDELKKSTCTKSIVDELERVKAELTAIKGVDELVEKREKDIREVQNSKCPIDMPLGETLWKTIREAQIKTLEMCIKDISLKQTPVKDSQPKEVEKAKKCLQCGTYYNGGTIKFCSSDCCLKWNGMK